MTTWATWSFWRRRIPFLVLVLLLAVAARQLRSPDSPPLAARGGELFTNFATLDTPQFLQTDSRWNTETVGGSGERLNDVGCAVCSLAMAAGHFSVLLTPNELNDHFKQHDGYNWRGLLKWSALTPATDGKLEAEVIEKPTHQDLDNALRAGWPVVAKLRLNGSPHWVVIVGKRGLDYLMRDPLGDGHSVEFAGKYESDIYGVRIIRPVR